MRALALLTISTFALAGCRGGNASLETRTFDLHYSTPARSSSW